jgi:hypothetical protein
MTEFDSLIIHSSSQLNYNYYRIKHLNCPYPNATSVNYYTSVFISTSLLCYLNHCFPSLFTVITVGLSKFSAIVHYSCFVHLMPVSEYKLLIQLSKIWPLQRSFKLVSVICVVTFCPRAHISSRIFQSIGNKLILSTFAKTHPRILIKIKFIQK